MDKQKVILAVTTDLNFDQRMIRICNALINMNFDVILVGRELPQSPPLRPRKYKQQRLSCFFKKGIAMYLEFNLRLFFYLRFKKFAFVTANDLDTVLGVYFGSLGKKCIRVYDSHEYFTEVPELANKPIKKKIWELIEKTVVPKFNRHYTVGNELANIFTKRIGKHFLAVRNVPEIKDEEQITRNTEQAYLLYQGALNKGRGLEALVSCMTDLPHQLFLAGDGDIKTELETLVASLNLQNKVIFLGNLSPKKLKDFTYNALLGFNLLDHSSKNYYYSLANKFFDYSVAQIPQICMDFPEYRNINAQYPVAVLVPDLGKTTLVSCVTELLNAPEKIEAMKTACVALRHDLNWRHESDKLRDIYY